MDKRKLTVLSVLIVLFCFSGSAFTDSCQALIFNGDPGKKIDLLLVGGGYENRSEMKADFRYYIDYDGGDRGLFDIFPMNITRQRFNVWYVRGKRGSATTSGSVGPFREARRRLETCEAADYSVYMAEGSHDWGTGAKDVVRIKGVGEKVEKRDGAIALNHEWGHLFGKLADEYNYGSGLKDPTKPNCAVSRKQAEKWWGEMAEVSSKVGFEKGCKGSENIEPHLGGTIMGDRGGRHSYGPVNSRTILKQITKETGPVTDFYLKNASFVSEERISVVLGWEKASHVAVIKVKQSDIEKKVLSRGTGFKKLYLKVEPGKNVLLTVDTVKDIEEIEKTNNVAKAILKIEKKEKGLLKNLIEFFQDFL